jgi:N-acetylneuraminic acid mutarotase
MGSRNAIQEYDPATNASTKSKLVPPFPLQGAAAVYVESRQAVYLLGGSLRTDILVVDVGQMVTTLLESRLPAPLFYASVVFVPNQDNAYLFGGLEADGSPLDTILEYDLAAGTVITLPASLPTPMAMASAIYDPVTGSAYLFGGQVHDYPLSQIVQFDVADKTVTSMSSLPVPCSGTSAVYVPEQHKAYIFGGLGQLGLQTGLLSQIIEFDISTRTAIALAANLPSERYGTAAVYVPSRGMAYILGGQQGPFALSDVVAFDVNQHTVTDITVRLDGREGASGVYVPTTGQVYLFGGQSGAEGASQSILAYNVDQVTVDTLPATLPDSRTDTAAVYDPVTNRAYIFGGLQPGPTTDRCFADILHFDVTLEMVTTAAAVLPTGRAGVSAVYVPEKRKAYLFGGVGDSGCLDQILAYDPVQDIVTELPAKLPRAAANAAVVYDTMTAKAYLFGGWFRDEAGHYEEYLNEIVAFDVATETATLVPARLPQFLARAAAIAIPGESTAYLIGGAFPGRSLSEIYRFDLVRKVVTLLSDIQLAESRADEVAVYVAEQMTTYFFGGTGSTLQPLPNVAALEFAYPLSATAQSLTVNAEGEEVHQALLTAQQTLRDGSVSYSLSNDGGQTWASVPPGGRLVFASSGSDLRWRAVLSAGGDTTPIVDSLTIVYDGIHQVFLPVTVKVHR